LGCSAAETRRLRGLLAVFARLPTNTWPILSSFLGRWRRGSLSTGHAGYENGIFQEAVPYGRTLASRLSPKRTQELSRFIGTLRALFPSASKPADVFLDVRVATAERRRFSTAQHAREKRTQECATTAPEASPFAKIETLSRDAPIAMAPTASHIELLTLSVALRASNNTDKVHPASQHRE